MSNSTTAVKDTEIVFDIGKYAVSKLGAFARDRLVAREEQRVEYLGLLRTLSTDILERKLVEDKYLVTFKYRTPSSWWQQLKSEKAPGWFKDKFPVLHDVKIVKRTVKITRKATYPLADVIVPKNMGRMVIRDVVSDLNFYEDVEESL